MKRENFGKTLVAWVVKVSSVESLKRIASAVGYNDSPLWGAEKKRIRIMGELLAAQTAIAMVAVNQVFAAPDAIPIINAFHSELRTTIFASVASKDPNFETRCDQAIAEYVDAVLSVSLGSAFTRRLGIDPERQPNGVQALDSRFQALLKDLMEDFGAVHLDGGRGERERSSASDPRKRRSAETVRKAVPPKARTTSSERDLALLAEMIDFGIEKGMSIDPELGLAASSTAGLIAGFTNHSSIGDLDEFLNSVTQADRRCEMVRSESLDIFREIATPSTVEGLHQADDPLYEIVHVIVEHPRLRRLRTLFHSKPREASELGTAIGVLVALTVARHLPDLADYVLHSAPENDSHSARPAGPREQLGRKRAVRLFTSQAAAIALQPFRRIHDPVARRALPHFTLPGIVLVPPQPADVIPEALPALLSADTLPSLRGLDCSRIAAADDGAILLLPTDEGRKRLAAWHARVLSVAGLEADALHPFVPALTVGRGPPEASSSLLDELQGRVRLPLAIDFSHLSFQEADEHGVWREMGRIDL